MASRFSKKGRKIRLFLLGRTVIGDEAWAFQHVKETKRKVLDGRVHSIRDGKKCESKNSRLKS